MVKMEQLPDLHPSGTSPGGVDTVLLGALVTRQDANLLPGLVQTSAAPCYPRGASAKQELCQERLLGWAGMEAEIKHPGCEDTALALLVLAGVGSKSTGVAVAAPGALADLLVKSAVTTPSQDSSQHCKGLLPLR